MTPSFTIFVAWLLFGGSHLALSSSSLRDRMPNPRSFTALFALVAFCSMSILIYCVFAFGGQGIPGPALGRSGPLLWVFTGVNLCGAVLMIVGLVNYSNSPMRVLAERARANKPSDGLRPPTQIERVTRHPFFVGLIMLMGIHALMAQTLAQAVYFAGFVLTAAIGMGMQDRKLRKRWQAVYADYEAQTPALPGQTVAVQPPPTASQWVIWLVSVGLAAFVVVGAHSVWSAGNGAVFAGFILLFGTIATIAALNRSSTT